MFRVAALGLTVALSCFATGAFAAPPESGPDIKVKQFADIGERFRVQRQWTQEFDIKAARNVGTANGGAGAKVWEQKKPAEGFLMTYTEEPTLVTEDGKGRPPKLNRTYEKAIRVEKGAEIPMAYQGKTVTATKTDKGYKFTYPDGRAVTGMGITELEKEFNQLGGPGEADMAAYLFSMMMPKTATVGPYDIDTKELAKLFAALGLEFDLDRSQGVGKVTKVYEKKGLRFATMTMSIKMPIRTIHKNAADMGSAFEFAGKMDICVDGNSPAGEAELLGKINGSFPVPDLAQGGTISGMLVGRIVARQSMTPLPAKR